MPKKQAPSHEAAYFLDAELHGRFHEWWLAHGKEEAEQQVTDFTRVFPNDPLIDEPDELAEHIRLLVEWEAERELVKTDLIYLCREYLGYGDLNDELHGGGIKELEEAIAAGHEDILVLWPRGHLKTSLFSIGRTIQGILKNQNCRKSIMSYAHSKAMEILAEIKDHLQNPRLIKLFPDIIWENPKRDAPFWREDRITVIRTKVVSGFTLKVAGIGAGYTGEHFEEMIFDDPHDIENTRTIELISQVIERFKNCASVLDPGGLRIVVGTIWANEDLYHWCEEHGFYVIRRTATENGEGKECDVDELDAHVIYPEKFTLEILKKKKSEQGRAFYAKQYNLIPLAAEDIRFKEELLLSYEKEVEYRRIYILIDPALSREKQHDDAAADFIGVPKDDKLPLHVMKAVALRKKTKDVIDFIFHEYTEASRICPDVVVGVEQAALQYVLIEWIEKEMQIRKIFFKLEELKHHNRPKPERIAKLEPLFDKQGITLNKFRCGELRRQLINYGASKKVDLVDVLAYLPQLLESAAPVQVIDPYARQEKYDPYSLEAVLAEMDSAGESWRDL